MSEFLELSSWRQSRGYAQTGAEIWSSLHNVSLKPNRFRCSEHFRERAPAAGQD